MSFYFACFAEAALLGVAGILGWAFNYKMFQDLHWRAMDLGWGVVATLPMLAGYAWVLKSRSNAAAGIRRFFEHVVRPVFSGWSLLQLAVISVLAGLCEEVLFRGVIQGGLAPITGTPLALTIASVAFGLAHPVSKHYVVAAGLVGLFLGGLVIVTGNLLAPVIAHALYDFCALTWFLRVRRGDPR